MLNAKLLNQLMLAMAERGMPICESGAFKRKLSSLQTKNVLKSKEKDYADAEERSTRFYIG
jgi:hypothetical protein